MSAVRPGSWRADVPQLRAYPWGTSNDLRRYWSGADFGAVYPRTPAIRTDTRHIEVTRDDVTKSDNGLRVILYPTSARHDVLQIPGVPGVRGVHDLCFTCSKYIFHVPQDVPQDVPHVPQGAAGAGR